MTIEELNAIQAAMPTAELIAKARAWNTKLCATGGNAWSLRVPVSENDPDMIFGELCRRLERLEKDTWLSPVASELESQEAKIRAIWPGYPDVQPVWQTLNGLLAIADEYFKPKETK